MATSPGFSIQALIFDLDGVITDTAEYHYQAWKRMADEEGYPFTREDNEALRGVSRRESLNRLLKGRVVMEEKAQELMERKNRYYIDLLESITPADILPGALNFLDEAEAAGLKLAVGSASKNAHTVLSKLGILERFDAIGDGYCVVNTKPAPDLFLWTAGRLGVYPQNAIVLEDAEAGIDAALRGGFWAVGIAGHDSAQAGRVDKAHLVLKDLADAHVTDVLARLSATAAG
ncbi:MAG: beta-phosphoglucomutase [bacterium]|nr:beta-phosphoglucomutase [bacterium]